jgi:hypothetical protein
MTLEAVRGEIVIVAGLGSESRNLQFLKTVLDFLQEGRIIKVENDEVHYAGAYIGDMTGRAETPVKQVPPTKTDHEVKMPPKAGGTPFPFHWVSEGWLRSNYQTTGIRLGICQNF